MIVEKLGRYHFIIVIIINNTTSGINGHPMVLFTERDITSVLLLLPTSDKP